MIIGCDLDGVLARFDEAYGFLCRQQSQRDLLPPEFDSDPQWCPPVWYWPEHYGYTGRELMKVWDHITGSRTFWAGLPVLDPDGVHLLRLMETDGHDVYFLTTRPGVEAKAQSESWLRFQDFRNPTVLITGNKGAVAAGLKLDCYLDDKPENLLDIRMVSSRTRCYLKDRRYNAERSIEGVRRVANVRGMLQAEGLMEVVDVAA